MLLTYKTHSWIKAWLLYQDNVRRLNDLQQRYLYLGRVTQVRLEHYLDSSTDLQGHKKGRAQKMDRKQHRGRSSSC